MQHYKIHEADPFRRPAASDEFTKGLGTWVRVNHYLGRIVRMWTEARGRDPLTGRTISCRLRNTLYEVEIDLSSRRGWARGCRQVHIEPGQTRLRLFADEFEVLGCKRPSVRAESRPPLR